MKSYTVKGKWVDKKNGTSGEVEAAFNSSERINDPEILLEKIWRKIDELYYDGIDDPRTCVHVESLEVYRLEKKLIMSRRL